MPQWIPKQKWKDQDVYIIGGGTSLKHFDWNLLKSKLTIGCNDAFLHGKDICKICIFGDINWFRLFHDKLEQYDGAVFTNCGSLYKSKIPWLWAMPRIAKGVSHKALAWNKNTGALAINLALLLGAKRVFLLGFDMKLSKDGKANWHPNNINKPNKDIYSEFIKGCTNLKKALPKEFPGIDIYNVTDDSDLNIFPKIGTKEFWKEKL